MGVMHLIGVTHPFVGNFGQHQTDYATVVQRWLATSIEPFNPVMRFMGGPTNRLFFGDFPFTITIVAWACKISNISIELAGRLLSAVFFFLSLIPFYRLINRVFKDKTIVLWSLLFYLASPLTIIYGQSFLLEMTGLSLGVFGFYYFIEWYQESKIKNLLISALFLSLMLTIRIYFAPVILTLGFLLLYRFRIKTFMKPEVYLFCLVVLFLPLLWQYYAGVKAASLGQESSLSDNMRVFVIKDPIMAMQASSLKYYLPIAKIFITKVVTPIGLLLVMMAPFFLNKEKFRKQIVCSMLGIFAYLTLFFVAPRKFIEFEYYYLPLVPFFSILAAVSVAEVKNSGFLKGGRQAILSLAIILFSLRFSIAPVLVVPDEARYIVSSAEIVRKVVPEESLLVAAHGDSTPFLYYTDRDGWGLALRELEMPKGFKKRRDEYQRDTAIERLELYRSFGAAYFALADKRQIRINPKFFEYLDNNYTLVNESPNSLIYSLKK